MKSKPDNNFKISLVSMPVVEYNVPGIQLGGLKSFLNKNNIIVDPLYLYLELAPYMDKEVYQELLTINHQHSEMFFACLLFPEKRNKIIDYLNQFYPEKIPGILEILNKYLNDVYQNINWEEYGLIGFTITHHQLVASLALIKKIKKSHPRIPIIMGGSSTYGDMGVHLLKAFPEIDFIISGEGEYTFLELVQQIRDTKNNFEEICGLIWRQNSSIVCNKERSGIENLDEIPIPDYSDYFNQLQVLKQEDKSGAYDFKIVFPLETSRGCWWNKCVFCGFNLQWKKYRAKSIDRIIKELKTFYELYSIDQFVFSDNVNYHDSGQLFQEIINTGLKLQFSYMLSRVNLNKKTLKLMKDAGLQKIFIGVEGMSDGLLRKMNKGARLIDNILAIKSCLEVGIPVDYSFITYFPTETEEDIKASIDLIDYLQGYTPPVYFSSFALKYQSPVYMNPQEFNIKSPIIGKNTRLTYPKEIQKDLMLFDCDYQPIQESKDSNGKNQRYALLKNKVEEWRHNYYDKGAYLIYFIKDQVIEIYDGRNPGNETIYILKNQEKEIFLYCNTIRNFIDISQNFSYIENEDLKKILQHFLQLNLLFYDGQQYLSLPVLRAPESG